MIVLPELTENRVVVNVGTTTCEICALYLARQPVTISLI